MTQGFLDRWSVLLRQAAWPVVLHSVLASLTFPFLFPLQFKTSHSLCLLCTHLVVVASGSVYGFHPYHICISWALALNESVKVRYVPISWPRLVVYGLWCTSAICPVKTDSLASEFVVASIQKQKLLVIFGLCRRRWGSVAAAELIRGGAGCAPGASGRPGHGGTVTCTRGGTRELYLPRSF